MSNNYSKTINKVGIITIIWNTILSISKVIIGILSYSSSLISDGIHSASDIITTIIVMIGAKIGNKEADNKHPFGHERFESIASLFLAILLFITAITIGYSGITKIIDFSKGENLSINSKTAYLALGCAIASILIKGMMFIYCYNIAKKINSLSLKSDAYHHLSDSLSSIGSMIGIICLIIGGNYAIVDPIACVIISLFIIKVSIDIAIGGINQLVDRSAPESVEKELKDLILNNENVRKIDLFRTRQFGNKYYVEIEIAVDKDLTVIQAHNIAESIHDEIETKYESVKHCVIHVNPLI